MRIDLWSLQLLLWINVVVAWEDGAEVNAVLSKLSEPEEL